MKIINAMEPIIETTFREFSKNYSFKCPCDKCKSDILAITLNKFAPKYVSSEKGEVLVKALYADPQLQYDLLRELTLSAQLVDSNPKHE